MKISKTFYYQFGSEFTPDALIGSFPAPSGEYSTILFPDAVAHIPINIQFKVRTIHIKNITYTRGMAGNQAAVGITPLVNFYTNFVSTLVGNRPVGMVHVDSQFSMNTKQDIKHTFQIPQVINGIYDFYLYNNAGGQLAPWQFDVNFGPPVVANYFFDSFSITIEFNSEYEN